MGLPAPYYKDDLVTLYHGDCVQLLPEIAGGGLEMTLVTDPPYGMAYASNNGKPWRGVAIAGDDSLDARDTVLAIWGDMPALVFGTWKIDRPEGCRNLLIWDKGGSPGAGDLSMPWGFSHEEIYVLGKGFAGRRGGSVLTFPPKNNRNGSDIRFHPTEKPTKLMGALIAKCPGVIVDPFAGSGSTLRAAKDLGRKAIGIELDEGYCKTAADRLGQEVLDFGSAA